MPLPSIVLAPMRDTEFVSFRAESTAGYAQNSVKSGNWEAQGALPRSQAKFDALLPQGIHTPGHQLHEIRDLALGETVGHLWFHLSGEGPAREGYLYDIRIKPQYRGRGYAKAALDRVDELGIAAGVAHVRLHVFAFNTPAQALYRSHGYWITGLNMLKRMGPAHPEEEGSGF